MALSRFLTHTLRCRLPTLALIACATASPDGIRGRCWRGRRQHVSTGASKKPNSASRWQKPGSSRFTWNVGSTEWSGSRALEYPLPRWSHAFALNRCKPSSRHELRELFHSESLPFRCVISPLLDFVSASSKTGIPFLISCTATLASTGLHRTRQSCNSTHLQLQHSRSELPRI